VILGQHRRGEECRKKLWDSDKPWKITRFLQKEENIKGGKAFTSSMGGSQLKPGAGNSLGTVLRELKKEKNPPKARKKSKEGGNNFTNGNEVGEGKTMLPMGA